MSTREYVDSLELDNDPVAAGPRFVRFMGGIGTLQAMGYRVELEVYYDKGYPRRLQAYATRRENPDE